MAHECPLPYGCDVTEAPEGTKLAGAYEFRMDPADTEAPSTLPRVLLGLVLLLVAGFLGARFVTQRRQAALATAGGGAGSPEGPGAGEPVAGGYPSGSDEGGSAAGLAAAGAAGAGAAAVALTDDDDAGGDATAALPVDAPEEMPEAADSAEGAVGDMADQAHGDDRRGSVEIEGAARKPSTGSARKRRRLVTPSRALPRTRLGSTSPVARRAARTSPGRSLTGTHAAGPSDDCGGPAAHATGGEPGPDCPPLGRIGYVTDR